MIWVEAVSPVVPVATMVCTPPVAFSGIFTSMEHRPSRLVCVFPRKTPSRVSVIDSWGASAVHRQ